MEKKEPKYTGKISSVKGKQILIKKIKKFGEKINTNGDVSCITPNDSNFQTGQYVQFERLDDDELRFGKFSTKKITLFSK
ncbi:MAG: hypothetical protein WCI91_00020 [Candidatus Nomurabacteria bacterium]